MYNATKWLLVVGCVVVIACKARPSGESNVKDVGFGVGDFVMTVSAVDYLRRGGFDPGKHCFKRETTSPFATNASGFDRFMNIYDVPCAALTSTSTPKCSLLAFGDNYGVRFPSGRYESAFDNPVNYRAEAVTIARVSQGYILSDFCAEGSGCMASFQNGTLQDLRVVPPAPTYNRTWNCGRSPGRWGED